MSEPILVLGLEGTCVRGVRLDTENESLVRRDAQVWSFVSSNEPVEGASEEGLKDASHLELPSESALETPEDPLLLALNQAHIDFHASQVVLSLPLSLLLTKMICVPLDARENLLEIATHELSVIAPFPDEALRVGYEILSENETHLTVLVAALPEASATELTTALGGAGIFIQRTDCAPLGWLRSLWSRIMENEHLNRRLVLFSFDDEWDLFILEKGALTTVRGIGVITSNEELRSEVALSLIQAQEAGFFDEVVVCAAQEVSPALCEILRTFGPVRTVVVTDANAGVEGVALRSAEGSTFDVTPDVWREARIHARFLSRLKWVGAVAACVWALVMVSLFAVDTIYDTLTAREKKIQKSHQKAYRAVADMKGRVALVRQYSDHSHGALEILKQISDCLPSVDGLFLSRYDYVRNKDVSVQGLANERNHAWDFRDNLKTVTFETQSDDETPVRLFETVEEDDKTSRDRLAFRVTCTFPVDEDVQAARGRRP